MSKGGQDVACDNQKATMQAYEQTLHAALEAARQYSRLFLVLPDGTRVNRRVWESMERNWVARLPDPDLE